MQIQVENQAITYINRNTPLTITKSTIDLDSCYSNSEIVIEIHAAALNPVDLALKNVSFSRVSGSRPKILGKDYSGQIVRAGDQVEGFAVGDYVNGFYVENLFRARGSCSYYLVLDPKVQLGIGKIPVAKEINDELYKINAAWPLVFSTAFDLLNNFIQNWSEESIILVLGASTQVGAAVCQIAKNHLKVKTVVGVCSQSAIDYNKKVGFDHLVPYDDETKSPVEYVMELQATALNNQKFDLIADCAGGSTFLNSASTLLKPKDTGSYYLTISGDNKIDYSNLDIRKAMNLSAVGRMFNPWKKFNYSLVFAKPTSEAMKLGREMVTNGTYTPVIDSTYSFDQYQDAMDRLASNKTKGKLVIMVK